MESDLQSNETTSTTSFETLRYALIIVSSSFSVAGACIIITSFLLVKSVRTASRCIVVVMALADIMVAVPCLISGLVGVTNAESMKTEQLCKIQSLFTSSGAQISFIWTAGLAQHMFILVACRKEAVKGGFAILTLLTVAVVAENVYLYCQDILGESKIIGLSWCWIKITKDPDCGCKTNCTWMLWDGKILEITMYIAVFVYYFLLYTQIKHLKNRNDFVSSSLVTVISRTGKIVAIPFVFVLVRVWGTLVTLWLVRRNCSKPDSLLFDILLTLMAFFDMSQGWINFVLYFLTTRQEFRIVDTVKLAVRSLPYMAKKRRLHSSENSYLTYNTSGGTGSKRHSSSNRGQSRTYSSSPKVVHFLGQHRDSIGTTQGQHRSHDAEGVEIGEELS